MPISRRTLNGRAIFEESERVYLELAAKCERLKLVLPPSRERWLAWGMGCRQSGPRTGHAGITAPEPALKRAWQRRLYGADFWT